MDQTLDLIESNDEENLYWENNDNISSEPKIRKVISRNVSSQRRRFR
jgi:hypothetical protein